MWRGVLVRGPERNGVGGGKASLQNAHVASGGIAPLQIEHVVSGGNCFAPEVIS